MPRLKLPLEVLWATPTDLRLSTKPAQAGPGCCAVLGSDGFASLDTRTGAPLWREVCPDGDAIAITSTSLGPVVLLRSVDGWDAEAWNWAGEQLWSRNLGEAGGADSFGGTVDRLLAIENPLDGPPTNKCLVLAPADGAVVAYADMTDRNPDVFENRILYTKFDHPDGDPEIAASIGLFERDLAGGPPRRVIPGIHLDRWRHENILVVGLIDEDDAYFETVAYDLSAGRELWRSPGGYNLAFGGDASCVALTEIEDLDSLTATVTLRNLKTGALIWRSNRSISSDGVMLTLLENCVLASTDDDELHVFDIADGRHLEMLEHEAGTIRSMTVTDHGLVDVRLFDVVCFAFETE